MLWGGICVLPMAAMPGVHRWPINSELQTLNGLRGISAPSPHAREQPCPGLAARSASLWGFFFLRFHRFPLLLMGCPVPGRVGRAGAMGIFGILCPRSALVGTGRAGKVTALPLGTSARRAAPASAWAVPLSPQRAATLERPLNRVRAGAGTRGHHQPRVLPAGTSWGYAADGSWALGCSELRADPARGGNAPLLSPLPNQGGVFTLSARHSELGVGDAKL